MKTKTSTANLEAFKNIIKRKILKLPEITLKTDNGAEFKNDFDKYLKDNKIIHRISIPYRHKQLANVESLNKQLGYLFNSYMNEKEVETDERYNEWTDIIKEVRKELNKHRVIKLPKYNEWITNNTIDAEKLVNSKYQIGDFVHPKLEIPRDALNNPQSTKNFRTGDMRFDKNAYEIIKVLYYPDEPHFRYILDGVKNVSYAEIELLPSKQTEKKYDVERFIKTRTYKKIKQILVKWKRYKIDESTWEPEEQLIKDLGQKHFDKLKEQMNKN